MGDWIKLHRTLIKSPVFQNEKLLKVFIWCLLKASHCNRETYVGLQRVKLEPGQFIFGRKSASEYLKMSPSTVYRCINALKTDMSLDICVNSKFSVITVLGWREYQGLSKKGEQVSEQVVEQQTDSRRTVNGQQTDTNKKDKKDKNEKKGTKVPYADAVQMYEKEYQTLIFRFGESDTKRMIEILDNYKVSKGVTYKDDYRAILSWVVGRVEEEKQKKAPPAKLKLAQPTKDKYKDYYL